MKIPSNQELLAMRDREASPTPVARAAAEAVGDTGTRAADTAGDADLTRFFPGFFEILLPIVLSAVPQILGALREQPQAAEPADLTGTEPPTPRFLPEFLSVLLPVLSAVVPILIEQISAASRDKAEGADDEQRYEAQLPLLISAIVPVLLEALRKALADNHVLGAGNGGIVAPGQVRMVRSQSSNVFLGALLQIIPTAIATVLPQLFELVEGGQTAARGERAISLADLRGGRLSDGDRVVARFTPLDDPDAFEISLRLTGVVTWWKGAQLRDLNGDVRYEAGPGDVIRLSAEEAAIFFATGGALVLGKAKLFGVHTWMYTLGADQLEQHLGKRMTLNWVTD